MRTASWVIRNRATGVVIAETFLPHVVAAINRAKYEAVPILIYLQEINRPAHTTRRTRGAMEG